MIQSASCEKHSPRTFQKNKKPQWIISTITLHKIKFWCHDSSWIKICICRNLLFHIPFWPVSHTGINSSDLVFSFAFTFYKGCCAFSFRKELDIMSCVRRDYFLWLKCVPPGSRVLPSKESDYSEVAPQDACTNMKPSQEIQAVLKQNCSRLHLQLAPG